MPVHARALPTGTPEDATDCIDAGMREPRKILAAAAKAFGFDKPVAVFVLGAVIDTI